VIFREYITGSRGGGKVVVDEDVVEVVVVVVAAVLVVVSAEVVLLTLAVLVMVVVAELMVLVEATVVAASVMLAMEVCVTTAVVVGLRVEVLETEFENPPNAEKVPTTRIPSMTAVSATEVREFNRDRTRPESNTLAQLAYQGVFYSLVTV
jgi:hypothetical protein